MSETKIEPTQEQCEKAGRIALELQAEMFAVPAELRNDGHWRAHVAAAVERALAAEAAPLREEIERLTKERDEARRYLNEWAEPWRERSEKAESDAKGLREELRAAGYRAEDAEAKALTLGAENTRLEGALQEAGATLDDEQAAHAETLALNTRLRGEMEDAARAFAELGRDCEGHAEENLRDGEESEARWNQGRASAYAASAVTLRLKLPASDNTTIRQPATLEQRLEDAIAELADTAKLLATEQDRRALIYREAKTLEAENERLRGEVKRLGKELNEGDQILALEQQLSEARAAAREAHEGQEALRAVVALYRREHEDNAICPSGDPTDQAYCGACSAAVELDEHERAAPIPAQPSPPAAPDLEVK